MLIFLAITPYEKTLVEKAKRGDRDAFGELIGLCKKKIMKFAYGLTGNMHDTEDLVQDSFVSAYKGIDGFKGRASFSVWVYRITYNRWQNERRIRDRLKTVSLDEKSNDCQGDDASTLGEIIPDPGMSHERKLELNETQRFVMRALDKLDDSERMIISLRDMENVSYEDIAATMKCPLGTVRSRLSRAREKLHGIMKEMRGMVMEDWQ
ncbi:MAG: sigma-70 family RNA polymerase sigma factor [bacterium]